ncbi:hypothetical protein GCM10027072_09840 [Streptomyces bullii]
MGEPAEIRHGAALRNPKSLCHLPSCDTGMPCHVREDSTVAAVRTLQEIFAE